MKRLFIQAPNVTRVLRDNDVEDEELRLVEIAIMRGDGDTIAGTGGLKKIRCAARSRGKSGSVRIIFADFPTYGRIYLLAAFGKSEKSNITADERNQLRKLNEFLNDSLSGSFQK